MNSTSIPEYLPELGEAHPVPDVLDVLHHEVLHEEVVGLARAGDDVREVGQLLDQDHAVVAARAQATRDGVGDEDGDQDGDGVRDLTCHHHYHFIARMFDLL